MKKPERGQVIYLEVEEMQFPIVDVDPKEEIVTNKKVIEGFIVYIFANSCLCLFGTDYTELLFNEFLTEKPA